MTASEAYHAETTSAGAFYSAAHYSNGWTVTFDAMSFDTLRAEDCELVWSAPVGDYVVLRPRGSRWNYIVQHGTIALSAVDIPKCGSVVPGSVRRGQIHFDGEFSVARNTAAQ
jgi:hypothetical protein